MSLSLAAAFWLVPFFLVITPGADWAHAISAGLRGRANVVPAVAGLVSGALLATALVAAGIGALVAASPWMLTSLTLLGALYLAWLGVAMLRSPPAAPAMQGTPGVMPGADPGLRWFTRDAGISGLNPKLLLLLLALLPQFVNAAGPIPVPAQILLLGGIHAASCFVVYLGVGYAAQRVLGTRPEAATAVSRASGLIMIAIAAMLLFDR